MTDLNLETIERNLDVACAEYYRKESELEYLGIDLSAVAQAFGDADLLLTEVRRLEAVDEDARREISIRLGLTVAGESPSCLADFEDEIVRLREQLVVVARRAFVRGYAHGHNDTVEGGYLDAGDLFDEDEQLRNDLLEDR